MPTYNPTSPWTGPYPVEVVDEDTGRIWNAVGPNQLKPPPVVIPAPPTPEDCCRYVVSQPGLLNLANPPAQPAQDPVPAADKSDGDTLDVCYDNGTAIYACVGGNWELVDVKCVPMFGDFTAGNAAGCDESEGLPVGKNAAGELVSQPPTKCGIVSSSQPVVTVAGAALTALVGGNQTLFSNLCAKLTNDSCYPHVVDATFRSNFSMQMAPGIRNYWVLSAAGTASGSGTGSWTGVTVRRQTACETNTCIVRSSTPLAEFGTGIIDPGEDIEFCQDVMLNLINYTEAALNSVQSGANTVKVRSQACQGGFLPFESTTADVAV